MKIDKNQIENLGKVLLKSAISTSIISPNVLDIFDSIRKSKEDIGGKIEKAYLSLKETSSLIEDLQSELETRTKMVEELNQKYKHYSELAEIEENKIKPLLKELDKTLNKGKNWERFVSFIINIIAGLILFVLGIGLGPKITKYFSDSEKPKTEIQSGK